MRKMIFNKSCQISCVSGKKKAVSLCCRQPSTSFIYRLLFYENQVSIIRAGYGFDCINAFWQGCYVDFAI